MSSRTQDRRHYAVDLREFSVVPMNAITFAGVSKSYDTVRAVESLDLEIGSGQAVALLGPNGAGKSTSIGMLLGLVRPSGGTVSVFGETPDAAVRGGTRLRALPPTSPAPARIAIPVRLVPRRRRPAVHPFLWVTEWLALTGVAACALALAMA